MFKLYIWDRVGTFREYADGQIVVMASSLDEARSSALEEATSWFASPSYDSDEAKRKLKNLKEELDIEPKIYSAPKAYIIRGSM